jgi:hypothetical protein
VQFELFGSLSVIVHQPSSPIIAPIAATRSVRRGLEDDAAVEGQERVGTTTRDEERTPRRNKRSPRWSGKGRARARKRARRDADSVVDEQRGLESRGTSNDDTTAMAPLCRICRRPVDEMALVRCGCSETFHGSCIGLHEGAGSHDYVCDSCDSVAEEVERLRASMQG